MAKSALVTMGMLLAVPVHSVTPIQKVLTMMEEMKAKGISEKKAEEVRFSTFSQWCSNTNAARTKAIEEGAARIEKLDADIATASSDIQAASADLAELDEDLNRWDTDKKAATDVRKKERVDYDATHQDYADTLDAVERALIAIKKMPDAVAQGSFIQTDIKKAANAQLMPTNAKTALVAFLATVANPLDVEAPEANAYESHSDGVIKMLEDLRVRFRSEKTDLEKEEISARSAYQSIMQRLTDQIELANQEVSQKTKFRAQRQADKAEAEGDLAETQRIKAEDEKYLSELNAMCSKKSSDFESRQQLRAGEIEALSKAIEIIGSQAVKGSGEKHLPSLAQDGMSLAQLRSSNPDLKRVAVLLAERAKMYNNPTLALIAQKATTDPFGKVKKMIQDLIVRLMEEAKDLKRKAKEEGTKNVEEKFDDKKMLGLLLEVLELGEAIKKALTQKKRQQRDLVWLKHSLMQKGGIRLLENPVRTKMCPLSLAKYRSKSLDAPLIGRVVHHSCECEKAHHWSLP